MINSVVLPGQLCWPLASVFCSDIFLFTYLCSYITIYYSYTSILLAVIFLKKNYQLIQKYNKGNYEKTFCGWVGVTPHSINAVSYTIIQHFNTKKCTCKLFRTSYCLELHLIQKNSYMEVNIMLISHFNFRFASTYLWWLLFIKSCIALSILYEQLFFSAVLL